MIYAYGYNSVYEKNKEGLQWIILWYEIAYFLTYSGKIKKCAL